MLDWFRMREIIKHLEKREIYHSCVVLNDILSNNHICKWHMEELFARRGLNLRFQRSNYRFDTIEPLMEVRLEREGSPRNKRGSVILHLLCLF